MYGKLPEGRREKKEVRSFFHILRFPRLSHLTPIYDGPFKKVACSGIVYGGAGLGIGPKIAEIP
jgi:hypothetical protein